MALEQKLPGVTATGTERDTLVAGVALFSRQPEELVRFHEKVLRVSYEMRDHGDGRRHWVAELGGVHVEIKALVTPQGEASPEAVGTEESGASRAELSFRVPDVAAACARALVSGGRVLQRAQEHSWGTFAVVLDPDHNRIGLYAPPRSGDTSHPASDVTEDTA